MSNSVRVRQPTRLSCPWDSPGKNTGVGCHFLLQCMKVKSESEVAQSCPTLCDPMDCSPPGSSIHGIFQARVLEWGAIAFSDLIPIKSQMAILVENVSYYTKIHKESPRIPNCQRRKEGTLIDFKTYYKVIKMVWYWHKHRYIEQCKRTECSELILHIRKMHFQWCQDHRIEGRQSQ